MFVFRRLCALCELKVAAGVLASFAAASCRRKPANRP